ncbi:hypothetical protein MINS_39640 [Mycolicibacterium insubricum]|nr:hypothetical protein MINS_39640 [Mycolicibacterium insubricum]
MHGVSRVSSTPSNTARDSVSGRVSAATTTGTTTKLIASTAVRNRTSRNAAISLVNGTCRKVA